MAKYVLGILQPSDEDNSLEKELPYATEEYPLPWSQFKRHLILAGISIVAAIFAVSGPMVSTSYLVVAHEFHENTNHAVQMLSGNFSLAFGFGLIVASAFGVAYGRRPAFLLSVLLTTFLCLWMAVETHYTGLIISRSLQGFAAAPFEVLSTGVVSDLYPVAERGRALAVVGAVHFLAILLAQVIGGFVVQYLGWRFLFFGITILLFSMWPVVMFIPETSRCSRQNIELCTVAPILDRRSPLQARTMSKRVNHNLPSTLVDKVRNWRRPYYLIFWEQKVSRKSFLASCLRPFPLLCYPAVIFGIIVHGLGTTYLQAFGFVKLRLFSGAPYSLTTSQIGLTVIPGAIAGLVAQYFAGQASDYMIKKMMQRNRGQYEPEYRLLLMIPQTIFSVIGILGFGISVEHGKPLWIVLIFYACVAFSSPFGHLASIGYLVDAMPDLNQEALVSAMFVRSILTIVFASSINGWLDRFGTQRVFIAFGIFSFFISTLTIPFYILGKHCRAWISNVAVFKQVEKAFERMDSRSKR